MRLYHELLVLILTRNLKKNLYGEKKLKFPQFNEVQKNTVNDFARLRNKV